MRKMIIASITTFGLIAVGLIILLVYAVLQGGFSTSAGSFGMKLVNTKNISLADINTIDLTYYSENVDILTSDTDELIFKEYMNYTPDDDELSHINTSGSKLSIKSGRDHLSFSFWPFNHSCRVEIYLPESYSGSLSVGTSSGNIDSDPVLRLSEFTAECTSGNIKVNEVYAGQIRAKASSGNISFQIAEGDRQFSATSGNIKVEGGAGDSDFDTSSGNIRVENASGHLEAKVSSGEMRFTGCTGGGTFGASSGNITLEFTSLTEDLDANVSSGNISLSIPETTAFGFKADTSSGDIHTFFDDRLSYNKRGNSADGTIGDNPAIDITLEATSGNIRVKE